MKTKQQVIDFLESKVGTTVPCPGRPDLDGQCVTLIKALMEFLGVPDPYRARGHAKTAIITYLNEGIADKGVGFLSVFSNKNMSAPYGHIWCNAGDGAGTYYEQNGQKALVVSKGKTYAYDNVCNFDKYIKKESEDDMANMYKGYDLANPESMKVAVDVMVRVQNGEFVDKANHEKALKDLKEEYEGKIKDGRTAEKLATVKSISKELGLPESIDSIDGLVGAINKLIQQEENGEGQDSTPPATLPAADKIKANGLLIEWEENEAGQRVGNTKYKLNHEIKE